MSVIQLQKVFQNVRDLEIHNYLIKYLKIKENKKKGRHFDQKKKERKTEKKVGKRLSSIKTAKT